MLSVFVVRMHPEGQISMMHFLKHSYQIELKKNNQIDLLPTVWLYSLVGRARVHITDKGQDYFSFFKQNFLSGNMGDKVSCKSVYSTSRHKQKQTKTLTQK